jgi:ketosteroid isomerase-like protein
VRFITEWQHLCAAGDTSRTVAVSRENLELVRSIFDDWERGKFDSVEPLDAEIEFVMVDGPTPGTAKGQRAMAQSVRGWLEAWEGVRQIAEEFRELDDAHVLVLHVFSARGKRSGLELGQIRREGAAVFTVRGGKVVRVVHYFDRDRAFADLGLGPSAATAPDDRPSFDAP